MADGRGGVGIRFYATGDEGVKRTFNQLGDSGKRMWSDIASGQRTMNPAMLAVSRGVGGVRSEIDSLAGRAGGATAAFGAFGAAGIGLTAALAGVMVAGAKVRESLAWADTLTEKARLLNISAHELQVLEFVADDADVAPGALAESLGKLNGQIGAMKTGVGDGRVKKAFEALRIGPEDLAGVRDATDLLPILAEKLGKVGDTAQQTQIARKLGIEALLPLLREGASGVEALTRKYEELGIAIDDETVAALDALDLRMKIADARINTQLRVSVSAIADDFIRWKETIAGVIPLLAQTWAWTKRISMQSVEAVGVPVVRGMANFFNRSLKDRRESADSWETLIWGGEGKPGTARPAGMRDFLRRGMRLNPTETKLIDPSLPTPPPVSTGDFAHVGGSSRKSGADAAAARAKAEAERAAREAEAAAKRAADADLRWADIKARMTDEDQSAALAQREINKLRADGAKITDEEAAAYVGWAAAVEKAKRAKDALNTANEAVDNAAEKLMRGLEDPTRRNERTGEDEYDVEANLRRWADLKVQIAAEAERKIRDDAAARIAEVPQERVKAEREAAEAIAALRLAMETRSAEEVAAIWEKQREADREAFRKMADERRSQQEEIVSAIEGAYHDLMFGGDIKDVGKALARDLLESMYQELLGNPLRELIRSAVSSIFKGNPGGGGFWASLFKFGAQAIGAYTAGGGGFSGFGGGGIDFSTVVGAPNYGDLITTVPQVTLGGATGLGAIGEGYAFRAAEHDTELALIGRAGRVFSHDDTTAMLRDLAGGGANPVRGGGPNISIPFAPTYHINGSGPEIEALRRQMAEDRATFPARVTAAVNDGLARGQVTGG